ncbi:dihydropyrimidinase [Tothia fuscella]|uniref:dihydropyrimidinase n=1 Tax=Tothia fuscella TaxID=1048955 RepID=A0A9P4NEA8_9PEZI|nr:dihydropyrimidinase [Tothia fuscella]
MELDLLIINATVVTASDILPEQQIAIKNGKITIDAYGGHVTPGGVDSHVHLHQDNSPTGDKFESGTRSAVAGGTTTILAFASQKKTELSLIPVVEEYHRRAGGNSYVDYGFHLILTNPTPDILDKELPNLVKEGGITSVKLYMTYDPMKLSDREILHVMMATRSLGMTTMIHAENADIIGWISDQLEKLLPILAETCPHYLYLTSKRLRGQGFEGAKCVCSPPLRENPMDLEAMWAGLSNGTFTTVSSDHAAHKFDHVQGKKAGLINGTSSFRKIPNGLPGLETRQPLLFSGVLDDKLKVTKFVELTSSNPAKLYGMGSTKGTIAPGYDADLVIWYPTEEQCADVEKKMKPFALSNETLHHDIDYSPFEGFVFRNWPRYTVVRGEVVWDRNGKGVVGSKGFGRYLKRGSSSLGQPRNIWVNDFRPSG